MASWAGEGLTGHEAQGLVDGIDFEDGPGRYATFAIEIG
jgi:hypothetical protein